MSDTTTEVKTVQAMLREFAAQPGCENYRKASEQIKLLAEYLWVRQLTPDLSFEVFIQRYAALADFNKENLKHPADAIHALLPRSKKQAEATSAEQWSAADAVDYVSLYVDIVRAAEMQNVPVPMTLNEHLTNEQLLTLAKAGEFKEEVPPKSRKSTRKKKKPDAQHPTQEGERCIYTAPGGRQHRGVIAKFEQMGSGEEQRTYVDIVADSGQEFNGVGIINVEVCSDPPPHPPRTQAGEELELKEARTLKIPRAEFDKIGEYIAAKQPVGVVDLGAAIYVYPFEFSDGYSVEIGLINGEPGPTVIAAHWPGGGIMELPPRDGIGGEYIFEAECGHYYSLTIRRS